MKTYDILNFSLVFLHNPSIYEISANTDWFSFEKAIFSVRLDTGTIESYTQKVEGNLKLYIQQAVNKIATVSNNEITTIIKTFFHPVIVEIETVCEELNLTQFNKLPDDSTKQNTTSFTDYNLGFIKLDVEIFEDSDGKTAKKIKEGDTVLSIITDERDIAHYLAHLIGGKKNDNMIPLPAIVKKISSKNDYFEIYLQYTPSIIGFAKVKNNIKLKVLETHNKPWWNKIIPWK